MLDIQLLLLLDYFATEQRIQREKSLLTLIILAFVMEILTYCALDPHSQLSIRQKHTVWGLSDRHSLCSSHRSQTIPKSYVFLLFTSSFSMIFSLSPAQALRDNYSNTQGPPSGKACPSFQ